jgi:DNA-binding transcriptional MerR regulator
MSLAEIGEVFELYDMAHGEERQLERYLAILEEKRTALLQQLQDVKDVLAELEDSAQHCRTILAERRRTGS